MARTPTARGQSRRDMVFAILRDSTALSTGEIARRVGPYPFVLSGRIGVGRCDGCPGGCSGRHDGTVWRRTGTADVAAPLMSLTRAKVIDKILLPDRRVAWALSSIGRRLVEAIDPDGVLADLDFPVAEHPSMGGGVDG